MNITKKQLGLAIATVAIVIAFAAGLTYYASQHFGTPATLSLKEADNAANAAETAAISARKTADDTRATAESADRSAKSAEQSAKDASNSIVRKPGGSTK